MAKLQKPGTINGAIAAALHDENHNVIGYTIDTPNAIAYAMAVNNKVALAVAHYQYFGDSITTRSMVADRFSWVIKESEIHAKNLTWC